MADIPALQMGNGFEIPPDKCPFPSIRPWQTITKKRLLQAEKRVLETLNSICAVYRKPCFENLQSLMRYGIRLLASFPELDHYAPRIGETYIGPIYTTSRGLLIPWSESPRTHIFAYLRPSIPGFTELLQALADLTEVANVTVVAPGIRRTHTEIITSPRLQIYSKTIRLDYFCDKAALAVTYGSFGTVSQFLLSGIPTLLVPQNIEQYLLSKQVDSLGAGLMVDQKRSKEDFTILLQRLLQEPSFRERAISVSGQYADYLPKQAVEGAVREIEQVLQNN